jgi:glutathione synthase/RimK-type ligase-like ATP-grasp enzyme
MGVDLIVDSKLRPRVIEVNGQPSMKLTKDSSDHYSSTKRNMLKVRTHEGAG